MDAAQISQPSGGNRRREFEFYRGPGGGDLVEKEIAAAGLSKAEAVTMEATLDRVECGDNLPNDIKHLRGPIWEVRISGDRRTFRLLYAPLDDGAPILLGLLFFSKKSQKTPSDAIKLAAKRLSTVREQT